MAEHPSIRSRTDNVVFVRFIRRAAPTGPNAVNARTCRFCAHWCGEDGGDGAGRCLADCGARTTPPESSCGEWHRPPLLTVV
jgi:hypothetical protein